MLQENTQAARLGPEEEDKIEETPKKLREGYEGLELEKQALNSPDLLETEVVLISKKTCKKRWPDRYHYIIDRYVICGKDSTDTESMSKACSVSIFI